MSIIDRRDFLKLVGAGGVGTGAGFMLAESRKYAVEHLIPYPVPPEDFSPGIATYYNSVCSMCSAGCGITVRTREGRAKKIEGNPAHPVNQGRLCATGQAGLQTLYNPDRITTPLLRTGERGSGAFTPTTWEDGLSQVAEGLSALRNSGQGSSISFLSNGTSGHLGGLIEAFMGQLGSDRFLYHDFSHPQTLYAAVGRLFGESQLPYYDIANTRYLLSFGADYLGSWISPVHHSLGFGRSRQSHGDDRGQFVQIEPRMSLSGAAADEWIAASPGTEGILALGIANRILSEGGYVGADRDAWAASLEPYSPAIVAEQTGISAATIMRLADTFAGTRPSLAIGGGAAGNHSNGVDTLVAVNALNYLAGNLGVEGGVVFNPEPVSGRGLSSRQANYSGMLEFAEDARLGEIGALIVNQTNPVFTLPSASGFSESLAEIPLIVSLSSFMDETTVLADIVLPSHTYLESWGDHFPEPGVGFSVGAVSQPAVSPLYDTRGTGDTVLALAQALDFGSALPWANMEAYLQDSWRAIYGRAAVDDDPNTITEAVADPDAATDLGGDTIVEDSGFTEFWASILQAGVWGEATRREIEDLTIDSGVVDSIAVEEPEFAGDSNEFPFILHPYLSNTMHDGQGANLPWMQELPDPMTSVVYGSWIELNPVTATQLGLVEGDLVEVESPEGQITAPVYVFPAIMPDVIAMPIGQGHTEYGRYAKDRGVNPIQILAPQTEAVTGGLAWSATRVKLVPTGRRVDLVKTGGVSRQLGRDIVRTTGSEVNAGEHASLHSIPITVVPT